MSNTQIKLEDYTTIFSIFNINPLSWIRINIIMIVVLSISTSSLSILGSLGLFLILHNNMFFAVGTALCFELGQILSLISYSTLSKQNKSAILGVIIFLSTIQVLANINASWFHVYNISRDIITTDSKTLIATLVDGKEIKLPAIINFFSNIDTWSRNDYISRILVAFLSGSLPILSLIYLKSLIKYFSFENESENKENTEIVNNQPTIEPTELITQEQPKSEPEVIPLIEDIKHEIIKPKREVKKRKPKKNKNKKIITKKSLEKLNEIRLNTQQDIQDIQVEPEYIQPTPNKQVFVETEITNEPKVIINTIQEDASSVNSSTHQVRVLRGNTKEII